MPFNQQSPSNVNALRNEIQNDPQNYGYGGFSDSQVADILNHTRDGTPCPVNNVTGPNITNIRRTNITADELFDNIVLAEYTSLTQAQRNWMDNLFASRNGRAPITLLNDAGGNTLLTVNLQAIFGAGTTTRTRLTAIAQRNGSRAEALFGPGTIITPSDVASAR